MKRIIGVCIALCLCLTTNIKSSAAVTDPLRMADHTIAVNCDASAGYFFLATPVSDNIVELTETGSLDSASKKMIYKGKFKLKCYGIIPTNKYIDIDLSGAKNRNITSNDGTTATVNTEVYGTQEQANSKPVKSEAQIKGYCCKGTASAGFIDLQEDESDNKFIVYECTSIPNKSANYQGNIELHLSLKDR